jgi:predicted RNA methylase
MIEFQRKLMSDNLRNQLFYEALKKVIEKNKTLMVDIGSGTGFLSFLAVKLLGAKHSTLIEYGDILDVSKKIAEENNIKNLTFIKKHSTQVKNLPYKADLLVSETLGNFAFEENILETIEDGKRFLKKKESIIIPQRIT